MMRVCYFDHDRICIEQENLPTIIDRCRICAEIRKAKAIEDLRFSLNRIGNIECALKEIAKRLKKNVEG